MVTFGWLFSTAATLFSLGSSSARSSALAMSNSMLSEMTIGATGAGGGGATGGGGGGGGGLTRTSALHAPRPIGTTHSHAHLLSRFDMASSYDDSRVAGSFFARRGGSGG